MTEDGSLAVTGIRSRMLSLDGLELHVLESPGEGDPVFMFHGNSGSAESYLPLLRSKVGKANRLIAVSFPGHGRSLAPPNPSEAYTIAALGKVAEKVIEFYDLRRYWLMGQSLGGHALLEHSECMNGAKGLMLISSPPISIETLASAFKEDPSGGLLFKGSLDEEEAEVLARCFSVEQSLIPSVVRQIQQTDQDFRRCLGESLARGELRDERKVFEGLNLPVALVMGGRDRFLNLEYCASLPSSVLWGGEAVIFPEAGHLVHMDASTDFINCVEDFLRSSGT